MKDKFPMLAYKNTIFMDKTNKELQDAKQALQNLLNVWNELNLPELHCNLYKLAHNPVGMYREALKNTDVIIPGQLSIAARLAANQIQTGRPDLWSIEGKKVILNETLAKALIESQNIEVQNEVQKKFVDDVVQYVKMSNSVNEQLKALPWMRMPAVPFTLTERSFPLISGLELQADQLREIAKSM